MENYVLFTESTCDLTPDLVREMDVQVLPMTFTLDGQCYRNYPDNRELDPKAFYDKLRNGSMSTTSQVAISDYEEAFTPFLEAGKDILYLAFSSGLSGTYQASKVAIEELQEKFPGRRIVSIDSLQASMGEGLFAYTLAMMRKEGATMDALIDYAKKNTQRFCAWFTVSDLMFLKRGGRLSGAAAVAGTLLGIKPVLHVDAEGHLIAMEKVRGRRASLDALVKHFAATADKNYGEMTVFVSHGDCLEDAQYVADKVKAYGVHRGPQRARHGGPLLPGRPPLSRIFPITTKPPSPVAMGAFAYSVQVRRGVDVPQFFRQAFHPKQPLGVQVQHGTAAPVPLQCTQGGGQGRTEQTRVAHPIPAGGSGRPGAGPGQHQEPPDRFSPQPGLVRHREEQEIPVGQGFHRRQTRTDAVALPQGTLGAGHRPTAQVPGSGGDGRGIGDHRQVHVGTFGTGRQRFQPMGKKRFTPVEGQQLVGTEPAGGPRRQIEHMDHSALACIPSRIFSGVMGSSRTHTPLAR